MGIISDFKLGRTLTKLTSLFEEAIQLPSIQHGDVKSSIEYHKLADKLKLYHPDKVGLELTKNMMITMRLNNHERFQAQEDESPPVF